MSESKTEILEKLIVENDLNKETIAKLIEIIIKFTHSICSNRDNNYIEPLEIMAVEFKVLEDYYKKVINSLIE